MSDNAQMAHQHDGVDGVKYALLAIAEALNDIADMEAHKMGYNR